MFGYYYFTIWRIYLVAGANSVGNGVTVFPFKHQHFFLKKNFQIRVNTHINNIIGIVN